MGSEILLYGFGMICLSMIMFNIIYNMVMRGGEARQQKRVDRIGKKISEQLRILNDGGQVSPRHVAGAARVMSRTNGLMAFDEVIARYTSTDELVGQYITALRPAFIKLAKIYYKRESLQTAYYAYFISNPRLRAYLPAKELQSILIDYITKESIYCRINALKALYSFGDAQSIMDVLIGCDRIGTPIQGKIIQDGLLTYKGDHDELINILLQHINMFTEPMQVAILNYIRFKTGNYQKEMFDIMTDENRGKELRLAAIRYMGKYPYAPALGPLLEFANNDDPVNWEYAAISVSSLASYDGVRVYAALTKAVRSFNWYVRFNAASSLKAKGVGSDKIDEIAGGDRYARDMLQYRLGGGKRQENKKELGVAV